MEKREKRETADVIISSPAYGNSETETGGRKGMRGLDPRARVKKDYRKLSDPENLGRLSKYSPVDGKAPNVIITSPAYAESLSNRRLDRGKQVERMVRAGKVKNLKTFSGKANNLRVGSYSKDKGNLGNLKYHGRPSRTACTCKIAGELTFTDSTGFGPFKEFFTPESVTHPAKANLFLLYHLIQKYTEPGETVYDVMFGTGSTLIMSSLLGRNARGVELEKGFVEMARANVAKAKATGKLKGSVELFQGDARDLSGIPGLEGVSLAMFSPPYAEVARAGSGGILSPYMQGLVSKLSGIPVKDFAHDPTLLKRALRLASEKLPFSYSDDPDNIGNLRLGDVAVFSPPFANIENYQRGTGILNPGRLKGTIKRLSGIPRKDIERDPALFLYATKLAERKYKQPNTGPLDPAQIGTKDGKTYLSEMLKVYAECFRILKPGGKMILIVKDFLKKGKLVLLHEDTIDLCRAVGFDLREVWKFKLPTRSFWRILYYRKHPDAPRIDHEHILVFQKPGPPGGEIIITSPPYESKVAFKDVRFIRDGIAGGKLTHGKGHGNQSLDSTISHLRSFSGTRTGYSSRRQRAKKP